MNTILNTFCLIYSELNGELLFNNELYDKADVR